VALGAAEADAGPGPSEDVPAVRPASCGRGSVGGTVSVAAADELAEAELGSVTGALALWLSAVTPG